MGNARHPSKFTEEERNQWTERLEHRLFREGPDDGDHFTPKGRNIVKRFLRDFEIEVLTRTLR